MHLYSYLGNILFRTEAYFSSHGMIVVSTKRSGTANEARRPQTLRMIPASLRLEYPLDRVQPPVSQTEDPLFITTWTIEFSFLANTHTHDGSREHLKTQHNELLP